MPSAHDAAVPIDVLALRCRHLRVQLGVCIWKTDAVKYNLQVPLPDEVPRLLGRLEMPGQVGAARKRGMTELR
jgi:hypothetical protein